MRPKSDLPSSNSFFAEVPFPDIRHRASVSLLVAPQHRTEQADERHASDRRAAIGPGAVTRDAYVEMAAINGLARRRRGDAGTGRHLASLFRRAFDCCGVTGERPAEQ